MAMEQITDKVTETDVLVVGGGLAGCFAAIKAKEQGVDVTLVDKGYVSRSGQTPFAGRTAVFNPEWGHKLEIWMDRITTDGEYLNNREFTETVIKDSYARYQDLISYGVEFLKDENGEPRVKEYFEPWGMNLRSNLWAARKNNDWIHTPMEFVRKYVEKIGVHIIDRITVTDLLKQDGRVIGAIGISVDTSDLYVFRAKATVISTGAGGFRPWTGWPIANLTADGHVMAYKAGAEITGKEFTDFHSYSAEMVLRSKRPSALRPVRPISELELLDAEGNKIVQMGGGISGTDFAAHAGLWPFKDQKGKTNRSVGGAAFGMSHHTAEGIWPINTSCASSVPGLYAAGDSCGTMSCGACYAHAHATATASSTGARAGLNAAKYALQAEEPTVDEEELARLKKSIYEPLNRKGGFGPRWVTQLLQNLMVPYFILRVKNGERLQATLTLVEFMRDHLVPKLKANDPHELRLAYETKNMVINAEMRLKASLFRTESRGLHYREDYPRRDDPNWLAWVLLKEEQGKMKAFKKPIPKEWWPDLSKPYEERYPSRFPGE